MIAAMGRGERSLREELLAARDRLTRQIERLEHPATVLGPAGDAFVDNGALIAELVGVRREIDLRLSELGPDPIAG
jgi:hypothetical protein